MLVGAGFFGLWVLVVGGWLVLVGARVLVLVGAGFPVPGFQGSNSNIIH